MPLVCIHCALVALRHGQPQPTPTHETIAEHMKRLHSDIRAMHEERREVEAWLARRFQLGEESNQN